MKTIEAFIVKHPLKCVGGAFVLGLFWFQFTAYIQGVI